MGSDDALLLQQTPGLRDLELPVVEDLLAKATPRHLDAGEWLFEAGQEFHDEIYILRNGTVELHRSGDRVERTPPGFFLGLSGYLSESPYASSALVKEASELLVLKAADLRSLEQRHSTLFDAINRLIAVGLRKRSGPAFDASSGLSQPARTVMTTPLSIARPDLTLRDALTRMLKDDVGSLVVIDDVSCPAGIVTYRSLAKYLARSGVNPGEETVTHALQKVTTVSTDTPLWEAQDIQRRERVKYLVVVDGGRPVGMLSQTDIVRALVSRQGGFNAEVARSSSYDELADCFHGIVDLAVHALETNRRARVAVQILSEAHLAIQRRCVELTLAQLQSQGSGPPPAHYALIIMGSGGRREMMLDPDQDNGIILAEANGEDESRIAHWFETFTDRLNVNLDRAGYILCPGDIMARNPMYRKTLSSWQTQTARLAKHPSEKAARWSNIFFDFDTLYGDDALTRRLRTHVNEQLRENVGLLRCMGQDDAQGRAPITWFNRLIATGERDGKETVDVKRNGLRMVANAARIFALRTGIEQCNTSDRIEALVRHDVLSRDFGATVSAAYDELLDMLLLHQIHQKQEGKPLDKEVAPEDLTPPAREALRVSMRAVKRFQEKLQEEIGGGSF